MKDSHPPVPAVDRRRRAAAERQRRAYRRRVLGIGLFSLPLPTDRLADWLIDRGLVGEAESSDHAAVERALARYIEKKLTRENASGTSRGKHRL